MSEPGFETNRTQTHAAPTGGIVRGRRADWPVMSRARQILDQLTGAAHTRRPVLAIPASTLAIAKTGAPEPAHA